MRKRRLPAGLSLGLVLIMTASFAACGGGKASSTHATGSGTGASSGSASTSSGSPSSGPGGSGAGGNDGGITLTGTGGGASCAVPGLNVTPSGVTTITVAAGQTTPTVTFDAATDCVAASVGWGVDKGNVATIPPGPSKSAVLTPSGTAGGLVTVTAGLNTSLVSRQVLVKLTAQQNGPNGSAGEVAQIPTTVGQLTAGGGVGGVGGEGLGTAVTDAPTLAALGTPSGNGAAQGLAFLYPYDKTVWPRGILAPLLQWSWATGDADAIQIQLSTTTGSFSYTGTFAKPAILAQTGGNFVRMPIPQDVWDMATNTAGGSTDQLTVSLTVAKNGVAYGPISETWTIAPTRLSGTIYYNSYGTQLVQNFSGAVGGNGQFGGAVLSIHVGDTAPKLVAGTAAQISGCRVCHSVAASGASLVVQHGESYGTSSAYELSATGSTETVMANGATYPAMYPDGSLALSPGGFLLPLPAGGPPVTTTGLAATNLGQPAFSPDGTQVVFNPLSAAALTTGQTLYVQSFDKTTNTFGSPLLIANTGSASIRPAWPAFFPDSKSVVFHHQTVASSCDGPTSTVTRSGARSQIYWTNLTGPTAATPLDNLNGAGYLPKLAAPSSVACSDACGTAASATIGTINADHSDDVDVNYEPTVAPVASGGYAWVVFTSRRMYGSVATIGSFCSDPRGVNLITNITPKKLWVAAIDLSQGPGVDASHPAFYLPAQELLAGNARGFWTLDPCAADGSTCQSGDECCNGYCEPAGDGGALVCSNAPPSNDCSAVGDKCTTAASCCDTTNLCINGFCAQQGPQ